MLLLSHPIYRRIWYPYLLSHLQYRPARTRQVVSSFRTAGAATTLAYVRFRAMACPPTTPYSITSFNCTLFNRRLAISTYSGFSSMPIDFRWCCVATRRVVPLPANGSRTTHRPEPSLSEQEHVGRQPMVLLIESMRPPPDLPTVPDGFPVPPLASCAACVLGHSLDTPAIRSTTRSHGAPQ